MILSEGQIRMANTETDRERYEELPQGPRMLRPGVVVLFAFLTAEVALHVFPLQLRRRWG